MNLERASGVQLHPTSLPDGRLGPSAYAWVDWLADAGQSYWQMLPVSPPDRWGSPYKARSAFAASPALLADPTAPVGKEEEIPCGTSVAPIGRTNDQFRVYGWER